jgi:thioredoxin 1
MENVTELNEQNFDSQVLHAAGPVLVDFWAPWCGPCRMQHPILEAVATRVNGRAMIAKVNVDEAPSLAERYGITSIPTLLLFKGGEMVRQFVGLQSEPALVKAIEAVK